MPASRETKRAGGSAVALVLTVCWVSCGGKSAEDGPSPASGRGGQSAAGSGAVGGMGAVGGTGSPGGTGTGAGTSSRGGTSSGDAGRAVGGSHGGGAGGGGAAGGGGGGRGGAGAGGAQIPLTGGTSGKGGSSGASGGVKQAGGAGDPGDCDTNALWQAVTRGAVATRCDLVDPPPEGDAVDQLHGAVVIDDEGQVVDNTGLTDTAKQGWLSELAGQRWLCLAGTTLGYGCEPIRD